MSDQKRLSLAKIKQFFDRDKEKSGFQWTAPDSFARKGVENIQAKFKADPGQYSPTRLFANAPLAAQMVFSPKKFDYKNKTVSGMTDQFSTDAANFTRGATQLHPFQLPNIALPKSKSGKLYAQTAPQDDRGRRVQNLGRNVYGTLLTAPLGGQNMLANVGTRAVRGGLLGAGMHTGSELLSGAFKGEFKLPTGDSLKNAAINGMGNSWQLAFTDMATSKVLAKSGFDKLVGDKITNPFVQKQFKEGIKRVFLRALAEVPAENTLFTLVDKLSGEDKRDFIEAWALNLPGTIAGNLAFAGLQAGGNILKNLGPAEKKAVADSLAKTAEDFKNKGAELKQAIDDTNQVELKWSEGGNEFKQEMSRGDAREWTARLQAQGLDYKVRDLPGSSGEIRLGGEQKGDLASEARKYKSAEEFVREFGIERSVTGQPTTTILSEVETKNLSKTSLFHGTDVSNIENIVNDGRLKTGTSRGDKLGENTLSLSKNKSTSASYGNVIFDIDKSKVSPRNVKMKDVLAEGEGFKGFEVRHDKDIPLEDVRRAFIDIGSQENPDGEIFAGWKNGKETWTTPSKIKQLLESKGIETFIGDFGNKQQLTDIYNQASGKAKLRLPQAEQQKIDNNQKIIDEGKKVFGKETEVKGKTPKEQFEAAYSKAVDKYSAITSASDKTQGILKTKGKGELPTKDDPTFLLRRMMGSGGIATERFESEFNPILKEMEDLKIDKVEADQYLLNKKYKGLDSAGRNIRGIKPEKAKETVAALEGKYGEDIINLSNKIYAYQDKMFNELIEAGFMDKQQASFIKSNNPDYSPGMRVIDKTDDFFGIPVRGAVQTASPIKGLKGSDKEFTSPIEAIIFNTFKQRAAIEKNNVAKSIIGLQEYADLGYKQVPKAGNDTLSVWVDGTKQHWKVGEEIAEAAKGLNEQATSDWVKIFKPAASLLRQGATGRNPAFMIPNIIRDQLDAGISSKYGYIPFVDYTRGLFELGKHKSNMAFGTKFDDSVYKQWANSGAKIDLGELSGRKSISALFEEKQSKKRLSQYLSGALDEMGDFSEQPTRLGLFKKALDKTGDPLKAMMESRDATVDFARFGSATKDFNSITPFFNVGIQGFDKLIRAVKDRPFKTAALMGLYGALPSASLTFHNLEKFPDEYNSIPDYEKNANFIYVYGRSEDGKAKYLTFPKGNIVPIAANPTEDFINYMYDNDRATFKEMALELLSGTLPVVGEGKNLREIGIRTIGQNVPQAVKPIAEDLFNTSFYKTTPEGESKQIVPDFLKKKEPYQQDYEFTPQAYKKIGAILNVSPLRVKNMLEGYGAGYAKIPVNLIENMYDISRGERVNPNEIFLLRRFVKEGYEDVGSPSKYKTSTKEEKKTPFWERVTPGASASTGDVAMESKDLEAITSMPYKTAYDKVLRDKEAFKAAVKVYKDEDFPDEVKENTYKELGIKKDDMDYYAVADEDNDVKFAWVMTEIQSGKIKNREEFLKFLGDNRKEIGGEKIAADGVIDELRTAGLLSPAEAKALKAMKPGADGKITTKVSGRGNGATLKAAKPKKISTSIKKISPSKIKTAKTTAPKTSLRVDPAKMTQGVNLVAGTSKPADAIAKIKARRINL